MQNQMNDKSGVSVNGNIDIYDGLQFRRVAELDGPAQIALYDCSPELGKQRVYSPNNPPPGILNIINVPTTFNIPQDFPDIYSAIDYLNTCIVKANITLQLADGTYDIPEQINLENSGVVKNFTILIQGNSTDRTKVVLRAAQSIPAIMRTNFCNVIIINLTIDGNNLSGGIINWISDTTIHNCVIRNTNTYAVLADGNCFVRLNGVNIVATNAIGSAHGGKMAFQGNPSTVTGAVIANTSSFIEIPSALVTGSMTFSPAINTVGNQNSYIYR